MFTEIFVWQFFAGIVVTIVIVFYLKIKFVDNHIFVRPSIIQFEKILKLYDEHGVVFVREFVNETFSEKGVVFWKNSRQCCPNYKLWGAALIYLTYRVASYTCDDKIHLKLRTFIRDYFGDDSWQFIKFWHADETIFNSTKYYSDNGLPKGKERAINRGSSYEKMVDYADNELYQLTWLIINSVYNKAFM